LPIHLRNDAPVSAENQNNGHADLSADRGSVLANLPRTRPQRATARRAAARRSGARKTGEDTAVAEAEPRERPNAAPRRKRAATGRPPTRKATSLPKATAAKPRAGAKPPAAAKARPSATKAEPGVRAAAAPRAGGRAKTRTSLPRPRRVQLAEAIPRQGFECEGERVSGSVQPPGGTELLASAAEILGEIAKAGLSGGERLLKDALSLLSR
jgi:hypothetical protein